MVMTLGTNSNNDLYLGPDGNLVVLTGIDAIAAACSTATKSQLGEMVLQTGLGVPNFQTVWVGTPDYAIWQSYVRNILLNVEAVTQVNSLTLSAQSNVLSYTANITTIYGNVVING